MISDKTLVLDPPAVRTFGKSVVAYEPPKASASVVRVGVIGYGYWGPNIVRNFHGLDSCHVVAVCDKSPAALRRAQRTYPGVQMTTDFNDVLTSPDIDAV